MLTRAQAAGVVRTDLSAAELAVALAGLIATVGPEIALGRMDRAQGTTLCTRLLLR